MPDATVPRGYPFPVDGDPIDVAGDIQRLAEAIDVDQQQWDIRARAYCTVGGGVVGSAGGGTFANVTILTAVGVSQVNATTLSIDLPGRWVAAVNSILTGGSAGTFALSQLIVGGSNFDTLQHTGQSLIGMAGTYILNIGAATQVQLRHQTDGTSYSVDSRSRLSLFRIEPI